MNVPAPQSVSLRALLDGLVDGSVPVPDVTVTNLTLDSRMAEKGSLFFAYPGLSVDGREYIEEAIGRGASAVIYDPDGYEPIVAGVPLVPLAGLRDKAGILADRFYAAPSRSTNVIGITGTNGKTTCCYLLAQALDIAGNSAGIIGTLGIGTLGIGASTDRAQGLNTTPDPVTLHRELSSMVEQSLDYVCIEVSSHALDQGRVNGITFHATMFTNLSQDHLDYHGDMRAYASAKERLFTEFDGPVGVINIGDPTGRSIFSRSRRDRNWSFGNGGIFSAHEVELTTDGFSFLVQERDERSDAAADDALFESPGVRSFRVESPMFGRVNIDNLLGVITMLRALGISRGEIPGIVAQLRPAPGRMELIRADGELPRVVVDYAHTPDALEQALSSLREYCSGILWCVFGCGGDRDRGKRPLMGAVAEKLSDRVVVTDDNPRREPPQQIVDQILSGMRTPPEVIHERGTAIQWAISQAGGDDWVLVAGKGHETQQILGDDCHDFDDRHWVRECLGVAA